MKIRSYLLTNILIDAVLGILLGILLLVIDAGWLLGAVFVIAGIITAFYGIVGIFAALVARRLGGSGVELIVAILETLFGLLLILWNNSILLIVVGVAFIVLPILDLVAAKDRSAQLKKSLPKLILGAVMILLGPASVASILFRVAGWAIIALTIVYLIWALFTLRRYQNTTGSRIFADTTGDGKIDTVFVDTTGDGKADTATRYRDGK